MHILNIILHLLLKFPKSEFFLLIITLHGDLNLELKLKSLYFPESPLFASDFLYLNESKH